VTGSIKRPILLALVLLMSTAGCGDDDGAAPTGAEATTAAPAGETTTVTTVASTIESTTTPTTLPATTTTATTAAVPTTAAIVPVAASERLAGFFTAAEDLDLRIKAGAELFNDTLDPNTGIVDSETVKVIYILSADFLVRMIPGGMTEDLEVAVLAVFADLDSRIASLLGGVEDLGCLAAGGESAGRFPDDLATARDLAATAPAIATTPGSAESGMVAARLAYIQGSNWCCGSCGGYAYEESIEVDWEGQIFGPGWIDAPFVATFDGEYWHVEFPQAG